MAISKKQGIAIGVGVVAVAAIVGGVVRRGQPQLSRGRGRADARGARRRRNSRDRRDRSGSDTTSRSPRPSRRSRRAASSRSRPASSPSRSRAFVAAARLLARRTTTRPSPAPSPTSARSSPTASASSTTRVVVAWADWPLGIQSGKYDLITSNVTVTEERKELYDFASYREDLLGFYVQADSDIESIEEAADISGLKIAVGSGTNQEQVLLALERGARGGRRDARRAAVLRRQRRGRRSRLQSGRVDATFGPNATAAWSAPRDRRHEARRHRARRLARHAPTSPRARRRATA